MLRFFLSPNHANVVIMSLMTTILYMQSTNAEAMLLYHFLRGILFRAEMIYVGNQLQSELDDLDGCHKPPEQRKVNDKSRKSSEQRKNVSSRDALQCLQASLNFQPKAVWPRVPFAFSIRRPTLVTLPPLSPAILPSCQHVLSSPLILACHATDAGQHVGARSARQD
jgi:hypothetical protein